MSVALSSITAAVVGVVFNLAIWFGMHVLFSAGGVVNWFAAGLGLAAFAAMQWAKLGIITAILASGLLSLVRYLVF